MALKPAEPDNVYNWSTTIHSLSPGGRGLGGDETLQETVYLNGDLIPRSLARLSPFDHGFLYGYGLFETLRAYDGSIFRLDRHLARLHRSAQTLGIAAKLSSFDLQKACSDVLEANKLSDARLRLTISAGEGDMTPNPDTCSDITVFIAARRLLPLPPETYRRGFRIIVSSLRRNSQSPLSRLKSSCYVENVLARKGKLLLTPSIESGALPGITREAVLELAQAMKLEAFEREIELAELTEAAEAFLTNSILEIMPLTRFDDKSLGPGKPGALTERLMSTYKELVEKETNAM